MSTGTRSGDRGTAGVLRTASAHPEPGVKDEAAGAGADKARQRGAAARRRDRLQQRGPHSHAALRLHERREGACGAVTDASHTFAQGLDRKTCSKRKS